MSVEFWAIGSALAGTGLTLGLVAPTCNANDILIAQICSEDIDPCTAPDSTWTSIDELNNGAAFRSSVFWKRAVLADSGGTHTFASFAGTTGNYGVISAYRGCRLNNSPVGSITSAITTPANESITYASLTPTSRDSAIVACGFYADDATAGAAVSGTAPTFTLLSGDLETATGSGVGLSLFLCLGTKNVGGATGAVTQASSSVTDALCNGVLFELLAEAVTSGGTGGITYPRIVRVR